MSDGFSDEEDFELESDDDFMPASPVPKKTKTPTPSSKKRPKKGEIDDSDDFDSEEEAMKKASKTTPKSTPKSTPVAPKAKETKSKKEKPKESKETKPPPQKEEKPKEPEKPKEMLNQSQASEEVAKYLRQTNRPYSVLNVFENLHRRIGKTMLQKILDVLVDQGEICVKTYGKSQIYYYNQSKLPLPSGDLLAKVESQLQSVVEEVGGLEKELKEHETVLGGLTSQMSDADLEAALKGQTEEADLLSAKLKQVGAHASAPVDPSLKAGLTKSFQKYRGEWVKRKRIVMDAVDQIAEGMEKKRKDVLELCGVETDESVGVKEVPFHMRRLSLVVALLLLLPIAEASCPGFNRTNCFGHGTCTAINQCTCTAGWTGADCGLRACPTALPWVDVPSATDTVRTIARECSNMGKCDRATGTCDCLPGFEGLACERQSCPNKCSGHGLCLSMAMSAIANGVTYSNWDAARIQGCVCDAGYTGYDCSLRTCAAGRDPFSPNEVQAISCMCSDPSTCAYLFSISYAGQVSSMIPGTATAHMLQVALDTITPVPVTVTLDSGATSVCSATGVTARVTFSSYFGAVPAMAAASSSGFTLTVQHGGTPSTFGSQAATVAASSRSLTCSGRGNCNFAAGQCICAAYFSSGDGGGNVGPNADCGYYNTTAAPATRRCLAGIYEAEVLLAGSSVVCSGHGRCSGAPDYLCTCDTGWGSADCSFRASCFAHFPSYYLCVGLCPNGPAWFEQVTTSEIAHVTPVECSNAGICDYSVGTCICHRNFEGVACERLRCPHACSKQGSCRSLREMAAYQEVNGVPSTAVVYGTNPNAVSTWDADRIFGCFCDMASYVFGQTPRYGAFDCSDMPCPSGDDPWTTGQVNEVQTIQCAADGGTLTFTFRGFTTAAIPSNSAATQVSAALESLPSIGFVSVTMAASQLCTTNGACTSIANRFLMMFPAATTVTYLTNSGALPLLIVDYSKLTSTISSVSTAVVETQQGTTESQVCNGRGSCSMARAYINGCSWDMCRVDATSGQCICVRNFATSDGRGNAGVLADCGHTAMFLNEGRP
ncbi:Aste57867_18506 [Aphanomyces stellatus]|uniref:Homologous-pairing protein 2 homolog n=1 Tax=Aphanomyces stellatus TaxID=120398 RepID=A0A485LAI1_9STRA|nr:hypothetical protein As57867_018444 [Aphanomyces stellatus]VFT95242.1 Aste57867_18506 [Aphanomyces stellatus]